MLSDYPVEILNTSESVIKTVRIRAPLAATPGHAVAG
jgi:hypothetical protein